MKLFWHGKDGGPDSKVDGYFLIEWKRFFSIAVLRFSDGSREAYHDHAFDAKSWLLTGKLLECHRDGLRQIHEPSLKPIVTKRSTYHQVFSLGTSWVLTFRGPWSDTWHEYDPREGRETTLAHGREVVE